MTASGLSLVLSALAALIAVPAGVLQAFRASGAQRAAANAAADASREATYVDGMRTTMDTLRGDNESYRNELRQQRAEHRAEVDAVRQEYRQRIADLTTTVAAVSDRAEQAWKRAMDCENEREGLRAEVAALRRGMA